MIAALVAGVAQNLIGIAVTGATVLTGVASWEHISKNKNKFYQQKIENTALLEKLEKGKQSNNRMAEMEKRMEENLSKLADQNQKLVLG